MLALALLLILGATALTVGAVYDGGDPAKVEILGQTLSTTVAGVFFTGAATMLLFLMGVWLLTASMGRSRRKRAERKDAKARQRDSVARMEEERVALRAENERLAEELARRRAAGAGAAGAAGTGGAAAAASRDSASADTADTARNDTAHPGTGPTDAAHADTRSHGTTPHDTTPPADPRAMSGSDGRPNDRVIDHTTDLTPRETTHSGRHREV